MTLQASARLRVRKLSTRVAVPGYGRRKRIARALAAAVGLMLVPPIAAMGGPKKPETIVVHKKGLLLTSEDSIEGKEYELLGRVSARCYSISITETDHAMAGRCAAGLVSSALEMKADAVLGLHVLPRPITESEHAIRFQSGVSGIAVRTLAAGETLVTRRAAYVVAVLPLQVPDSVAQKAKEQRQLGQLMQDVAIASAEQRGYYAVRAEPTEADSGSLAAMSDTAWTRTFGPWTGAVLSTRLVVAAASRNLVRSKQQVTVEVRIFSRESARVIWSRTAEGEYATWGAVDGVFFQPVGQPVMFGGTKAERVEAALGRAVHDATSGAPPPQ